MKPETSSYILMQTSNDESHCASINSFLNDVPGDALLRMKIDRGTGVFYLNFVFQKKHLKLMKPSQCLPILF